ncbi:MAG: hypothetical protein MR006_01295, partial [Arcanobacterium sp.]|nr:hypothetical protein [Arcanobacterium sp.]
GVKNLTATGSRATARTHGVGAFVERAQPQTCWCISHASNCNKLIMARQIGRQNMSQQTNCAAGVDTAA